MNLRILTLIAAFAALLCAPAAHAQFELKGAATNLIDKRQAGGSPAVTNGVLTAITVRGGGSADASAPVVTNCFTTGPLRNAVHPLQTSVRPTRGACSPFCAAMGTPPLSFWI